MAHPLVGRRVKLIAGKMDEPHEGLDEWGNELHWYVDEIDPEDCLLNEFLAQVELI